MIISPPKINKGAPRWAVTFGDMMCLLMCFFVLLLSFSETDRQQYKQVAGSMEKAFGVQRKAKTMDIPKGMQIIAKDFDQEIVAARIQEELGKEIEDTLASQQDDLREHIEYEENRQEITLRLMGESTFDSGSVEIRGQLKPLLSKVAQILEKAQGDVIISGHTDNVPIRSGPYKSNLRLSIARAAAVAEFMLDNSRIDPKRVSTMGFGEYRPFVTNDTPAGRAKNRRVEIILNNLPQPERSR